MIVTQRVPNTTHGTASPDCRSVGVVVPGGPTDRQSALAVPCVVSGYSKKPLTIQQKVVVL